jgi:hypothetical protein
LIKFPKSSSILAATLGEKAPDDLQPAIALESGAITIAPLLLNPGDRFRVTAQLLGDFEEPAVEARISGIRTISRQALRDSSTISPWLSGVIGILGLFGYFYFAWYAWLSFYCKPHVVFLPLADVLFVTLMLGLSSGFALAVTARVLDLSLTQMKSLVLCLPLQLVYRV